MPKILAIPHCKLRRTTPSSYTGGYLNLLEAFSAGLWFHTKSNLCGLGPKSTTSTSKVFGCYSYAIKLLALG